MDENKENCMTKTKARFLKFYNSACFWPKLFISLTAVILAILGIYKIATSAIFYFDKPLSSFDPERLGQLGDFLGGTLNPIFGFLTVCLLLWSIFIQRKELSLTREELTKSANALNKQVELATDEYNRKQLEGLLVSLEGEYNALMKENISSISVEYINETGTPCSITAGDLRTLIRNQVKYNSSKTKTHIKNIMEKTSSDSVNFKRILNLSLEIIEIDKELIKLTRSKSILSRIYKNANNYIDGISKLGLIDEIKENSIRSEIRSE